MVLKRLIKHFTYRIEPKPEGGFIAHASDPTLPSLEALTREELHRKIQANIAAGLASEFPGLKLRLENQERKFAFYVERSLGGGFAIHSADPNAAPIEGAAREDIESHFAEKLIALVGEHFVPELSQALASKGNWGDIKVFVNRKSAFTVNVGSQRLSLGVARDLPPAGSIQPDDAKIEDAKSGGVGTANPSFSLGNPIGNSPITPEINTGWSLFRFLLALLATASLIYFLLHHR